MHREVGERGRRPEHPDCPGSGYCGRGCHHPHLHCIVPGGGIAPNGLRWVACRPGFFLPVRVLSRRFRELFLARLQAAFEASELRFSGTLAALAEPGAFADRFDRLRAVEWVVYAKRPFAGPEQVLTYLGRYTHRVALANSRLTRLADGQVDFTWKDYRHHGKTKVMTLAADEFIRRFLLHTVPDGFHRIRHIGVLANGHRTEKLALCRALLAAPTPDPPTSENYRDRTRRLTGYALDVCPDCGGMMQERGPLPRHPRPHRAILVRQLMINTDVTHPNQKSCNVGVSVATVGCGPMTNRLLFAPYTHRVQRIICGRSQPRTTPPAHLTLRHRPTPTPWHSPGAPAQAVQHP